MQCQTAQSYLFSQTVKIVMNHSDETYQESAILTKTPKMDTNINSVNFPQKLCEMLEKLNMTKSMNKATNTEVACMQRRRNELI